MRNLLYLFFFLVFCGHSLVAQNYYYSLEEPQEVVPNNATVISNVSELIAGLKSNSNLYLKAGDYILPSIVYLKDISNLHVIGSDNAIIKGDFWKLIEFKGAAKNISFKNVKFHSTSTITNTDYGAGLLYFDRANAENILFEKCSFTAPNVVTNGLKFINEVDARSNGIVITDCTFFDIGRMGIETQNHTYDGTIRLNNIKVTNCDFKNLGLQSPYGMAISLSGSDQGAILTGNNIMDSKDIGIEIVGWENVLISNNTFEAAQSEYQPFSIQKTIGSKDYLTNIKVTNNSGSSTVDNGKEHNLGFANLEGFIYSNNTFNGDFIGLFDVKSSYISNNVHTSHGKQIFAFFDNSHDNTITDNTFISTKTGGDGIVLYPGMTGNTFKNTTVILSGTGGNAFNDMNSPGSNENTNMTVQFSN